MPDLLLDFFKALRGSGLDTSPDAQADALHAARLVGWREREVLKTALGTTLAKSIPDRDICDETFERFFRFEAFGGQPGSASGSAGMGDHARQPAAATASATPAGPPSGHGSVSVASGESERLSDLLLSGDAAGLSRRLQQAARSIGLSDIWFFTQKGYYTQKIQQAMGLGELENEISSARQSGATERLQHLTLARQRLFEETRNHVERMLALHGTAPTRQLRDDALVTQRLSAIERRDFARMHVIVRRIARRLAERHARRRKRQVRGQLDFRKTLRRNAAYGGIMFETYWRSTTVERPRLVAICDVSGSVRQFARFLLLFLYCLGEAIPDIRAFAFTNHLVEVGPTFESQPVEEAVDKVLHAVGGGGTDYGQVMRDIAVQLLPRIDHRTTLLILGDARNNRGEAEVGIMQLLYKRARRVIWLNPEPVAYWGVGDSEMKRYASFCHIARECSTVRQLERVLDALLKSHASHA